MIEEDINKKLGKKIKEHATQLEEHKKHKTKVQEQIITLLQQRKDDLQMITDVASKQQSTVNEQLAKLRQDTAKSWDHALQQFEIGVSSRIREQVLNEDYVIIKSKLLNTKELRDLVKVSEVQDALRKISEGLNKKIEQTTLAVEDRIVPTV
mmetsp:Transcript_18949/g.29073  ORF Transcript_18949/g.29073 Transcript_18949/m.29073 type:complete len:152 (-) Transcript_18949:1703-2158(-)